MNPKYWNTLELPAILQRLAEHTSFSGGHELAVTLTPSVDPAEVRRRQTETAEARHLLSIKTDITLGGVHDLRPHVQNAVLGARLLPQDLLDVRDTLHRAQQIKRSIARQKDQFPILSDIAYRLASCPDLINEIDRCIDEYGQVMDSASPKLARVRGELKVAYDRLMDKLNRLVASPDNAPHLQEGYVTQRDGRYVIPVRSQSRGRFPGLIHDQSSSGATLFIEPMVTVELNNQYRELQLEEQHEVERILLALSGLVAEQAEAITLTVEALAELDLALAKAKYGDAIHATGPEIVEFTTPRQARGSSRVPHPGSVIDLRQARHPLIDAQKVVPINVRLSDVDGYHVIVITGPNTGGKTVSLKTVGLLTLMAQCGLHLPVADGARLTVFDVVCADIGDEQSIEQSLSTFSSHMTNIIEILETIDDRSLVLLDELGAGTDPVEGAALAQSLLMHLLQRRVTALVTTHHPELKLFAHGTPGAINASVEFDVETLSPTYHLNIGLPGHSNAFSIARRLGLPEIIVRRAQSMISDDVLDVERYLTELKEMRSEAEQARTNLQQQQSESERLRADLRERLLNIETEREALLRQAREQAAGEVESLRKELRELKRRAARIAQSVMQGKTSQAEWAQIEKQLEALEIQTGEAEPDLPALDLPEGAEIEIGDTVWVPDLNATGELLAVDDEAAEVQVGAFRVRTRFRPLELRHKKAVFSAQEAQVTVSMPPTPAVSTEIHLRGLRVDEGLPQLEKYLDDAYRARAPFVRIVHGKGTGRMKQAVRQLLREHPLVASFRDGAEGEGDTGVTIVKFKA